ncbi:MAG: hypothetical protein KJ601_02965 [Nanoarchaeota archaeon]|nr:hypothetical protein [Nanoarchaeota archaeon]MBU1704538.1 hypothetical protein [Nanoarchaeota archaeon]
MCEKCGRLMGLLLLVLGVLFLLQDLKIWAFWGISWSTAIILLVGLAAICSSSCDECKVETAKTETKKKKK